MKGKPRRPGSDWRSGSRGEGAGGTPEEPGTGAPSPDPQAERTGSEISEPRGYNWSFWRACLINLLCLGGIAAFLLFPRYLDSEGMSEDKIGLVEAMFWLASMGIQPYLGRRLDTAGRRHFFILGALLMALAAASYLVLPVRLATMMPARGLQGLGLAMYLTALTAWVSDHAPRGRLAEMLGIFGVTGLLGATVGPIAGEFAYVHKGYHGLFIGGAVATFVGALLTPTLRDRHVPHRSREPGPSYWALAVSPRLAGTVVGSVAFGLASGSVVAFVAPFLEDRKLAGVGVLFAVYALASGATRVYAGRTADRLGPQRVIGPSLLLQASAMAMISLIGPDGWRSTPLLIAAACVGGTGHGMVYPALSALAVLRLGSGFAGTGVSAVAAAVDLGSGFGAILAGQLVLRSGYLTMFVAMGLVVALLGFLFPLVEAYSEKQPPPRPPGDLHESQEDANGRSEGAASEGSPPPPGEPRRPPVEAEAAEAPPPGRGEG